MESVGREPRRRLRTDERLLEVIHRFRSGSLPCKSFPLAAWKSVNWVIFVPVQIQRSEEGLLYTQGQASTYGMCAVGGLDPGMWSPTSSTPPAPILCSLLQVDTSLATACPLPWSLCCLQVGR